MKTIELPGRIESIGETAHRLLTSQSRGKVLAVVSGAAYLLDENDNLCWLAVKNTPMHRRSMRLPMSMPRLNVGDPFFAKDNQLIIGSEIPLDFSQACIWEPPRLDPASIVPVTDLPRQLEAVASILTDLPAPAGFGCLIPDIIQIASGLNSYQANLIPKGIPRRAWPAIRDIATACQTRDYPKITEQLQNLAGLGEGLTPSGDDFIGGWLFCRKILQLSYPNVPNLDFPFLPEIIESLKSSTHIMSYTFMKDHAEGCAVDTFHQFANAILTGQPTGHLRQVASELVQIGHSTGWDTLIGFLVGLLLIFPG